MASSPPDPLDSADEHLNKADKATELLEYSEDFDEPTGKTEVTVNLRSPSTRPPQPSAPHIEVTQPEPGVFRIAYTAVSQLRGWPLFWTIAVIAACYTLLKLRGAL